MSHEQIERRLRAAYDATNDVVPPHFDVSHVANARPTRRPRMLAVVAVVAVVVGLVAVLYTVLRPADRPRPAAADSATASASSSPASARSTPSSGPTSSVLPTAPASTDDRSRAFIAGYQVYKPVHIWHAVPSGHFVSMPWRLLDVRHFGRGLRVEYYVGNGYTEVAAGFVVLESTTSVELIALSKHVPINCPSGAKCAVPQPLDERLGTVLLKRPLGDRVLLHGPVSSARLQRLLDRECCPITPSR